MKQSLSVISMVHSRLLLVTVHFWSIKCVNNTLIHFSIRRFSRIMPICPSLAKANKQGWGRGRGGNKPKENKKPQEIKTEISRCCSWLPLQLHAAAKESSHMAHLVLDWRKLGANSSMWSGVSHIWDSQLMCFLVCHCFGKVGVLRQETEGVFSQLFISL